jgi:ABC-type sugar transport system substrate-binding protein
VAGTFHSAGSYLPQAGWTRRFQVVNVISLSCSAEWWYLQSGRPATVQILLSLITDENDYQREQARAAEEAALRLGVNIRVVFAKNDAVLQTQQVLEAIQAAPAARPQGIMVEPVGGTAMPQVAQAAVAARIPWVLLNRDAAYLPELRKSSPVPVFSVTADHEEIGRIQGRQFAALLPAGGSVLYIQGPSDATAAQHRSAGMLMTKPDNVEVKTLRARWTEASAQQAVTSWLQLSTSRNAHFQVIGCQNDLMALGARKAFQQLPNIDERERWMRLSFTGCDGLPKGGQEWVRKGLLAATVIIPANSKPALELLVNTLNTGALPPERTVISAMPFPPLG